MFTCPECKFESLSSGVCPCSDLKGRTVTLTRKEMPEDLMPSLLIIKMDGNIDRFRGQKTGKLLSVISIPTKKLTKEAVFEFGGTLPRGTCIFCVYLGEKFIPFVDIRPYGSSLLMRLEKSIGDIFEIDNSTMDSAAIELTLTNEG